MSQTKVPIVTKRYKTDGTVRKGGFLVFIPGVGSEADQFPVGGWAGEMLNKLLDQAAILGCCKGCEAIRPPCADHLGLL